MIQLLESIQFDVAGIQEATSAMIKDLHAGLKEFSWIGVGRNDGKQGGEYTPIFYRTERFRLLDSGTFWLAADCHRPAKGWDAHCYRIVTWGHFEDLHNGRRYFVFNTHFDHMGRRARTESAKLILGRLKELGSNPVVLTGDLNCSESSAAYRILTGTPPLSPGTNDHLRDTLYQSKSPPQGPAKTYRGWLSMLGIRRIDYIFASRGFNTIHHTTIDDHPPVSDHRAVLAELEYSGGK